MDPAISIRSLFKEYKRNTNTKYLALRDVINQSVKTLFRKNEKKEHFLALHNINLDIQTGDRVGIIGHNGAGKSTLLKIISRITPPTKGQVTLSGRVASLLEVGTGFHPELTGRENIYLNGSILGLRKIEINRKLEEIIDFSGVEKFIDTPLKHYSTGMQLRLAFSVAAHLEAETVLIDEVLAVGDIQFQKKCLGKMEEISSSQGRTVLFVSHNLEAVRNLCTKSVLLHEGNIIAQGASANVIEEYLKSIHIRELKSFQIAEHSSQSIEITNGFIKLLDIQKQKLTVEILVLSSIKHRVSFEVIIRDQFLHPILFFPMGLKSAIEHFLDYGKHKVELELDLPFLASGKYFIDIISAYTGKEILDIKERCLSFTITNTYVVDTGWQFKQDLNQGSILGSGFSRLL